MRLRSAGTRRTLLWRAAALTVVLGTSVAVAAFVAPGAFRDVSAGFSSGSDCPVGAGSYGGLSAECPTGYRPATTNPSSSYAPGETFSFTVRVHNRTSKSITIPTSWGYTHLLTIQDSSSGKAPTTTIDVSNGTTPSGFLPLTDRNWFAYAMWRGSTAQLVAPETTFDLTVPAGGVVDVTRTGRSSTCGYVQVDLANRTFGVLSSGIVRILGCSAATPSGGTLGTTTTPTGGVQGAVTAPNTGADPETLFGLLLVGAGGSILFVSRGGRRRSSAGG